MGWFGNVWRCNHNFIALVVFAVGLSLGIKQAGPVFRLESVLEVSVDEDFNVLSLGANRESCNLFRRSKIAQNNGAEDWRERAPVTNNITCKTAMSSELYNAYYTKLNRRHPPLSKLKAVLWRGQTMVDPSPSLQNDHLINRSIQTLGHPYLPFSRGVPRWGQLLAIAKILPSKSAATRIANPSTSTGTRSPAAMSLDFKTGTHSSCATSR